MELARSTDQQTYIKQIRALEASIEKATDGEVDAALLHDAQTRLDALAKTYQYDDKLGTALYKLYELQAVIHYFNGKDADALDFINRAVELRGSNYTRADRLRARLSDSAHAPQPKQELSKTEKRKQLIGLGGWLGLFIVGVCIGVIYNIVQLTGYPASFRDIASVRDTLPDFVSAITPALWYEVVQFTSLIILGGVVLVALFQRRQFARKAAIAYLLLTIVLGVIDYAWASSIFNQYDLHLDAELSKESGNIGRSVVSAGIWVPYFLVSKRVKATLTK